MRSAGSYPILDSIPGLHYSLKGLCYDPIAYDLAWPQKGTGAPEMQSEALYHRTVRLATGWSLESSIVAAAFIDISVMQRMRLSG